MIKSLSGSIGFIELKSSNLKKQKNIYIFLDNHTNNKYCNNKNSLFLHDFIKKHFLENNNFCFKKKCNLNIFLEEVLSEKNMISLHKTSKHVNDFFNFYKNVLNKEYKEYTYAFDIRQYLEIISIVLIINNINNYKTIKYKYLFYYINIFLNLNLNLNNIKYELIENEIIIKLNQIKKKMKIRKNTFLFKHYNLLKKRALNLYNRNYEYVINCNEETLLELSYLIDNIMEFYCIYLIMNNKETEIILYAGGYHCINIAYQLINYYNYGLIYNSTTIDIKNLNKYKNDEFLEKLENKDNCIKFK
jgi:hypothetical protein